VLHPEEYAADQNRLRPIPVLDLDLFQGSDRAADPRVVVDDVELAEFLDRAGDHRLHFAFRGNVGALEYRVAAVLLALADSGFAAIFVEIGDHDRCALAGESDRGGLADTARGAGYYCDFPIKL